MNELIREFRTRRFTVRVEALPENHCLDLSWDEDGSVAESLNSGDLIAFCARVTVFCDGLEVASEYLGECIYKSLEDFMDHREVGAQNRKLRAEGSNARCGSYFHDMICTACGEARKTLASLASVNVRAAS